MSHRLNSLSSPTATADEEKAAEEPSHLLQLSPFSSRQVKFAFGSSPYALSDPASSRTLSDNVWKLIARNCFQETTRFPLIAKLMAEAGAIAPTQTDNALLYVNDTPFAGDGPFPYLIPTEASQTLCRVLAVKTVKHPAHPLPLKCVSHLLHISNKTWSGFEAFVVLGDDSSVPTFLRECSSPSPGQTVRPGQSCTIPAYTHPSTSTHHPLGELTLKLWMRSTPMCESESDSGSFYNWTSYPLSQEQGTILLQCTREPSENGMQPLGLKKFRISGTAYPPANPFEQQPLVTVEVQSTATIHNNLTPPLTYRPLWVKPQSLTSNGDSSEELLEVFHCGSESKDPMEQGVPSGATIDVLFNRVTDNDLNVAFFFGDETHKCAAMLPRGLTLTSQTQQTTTKLFSIPCSPKNNSEPRPAGMKRFCLEFQVPEPGKWCLSVINDKHPPLVIHNETSVGLFLRPCDEEFVLPTNKPYKQALCGRADLLYTPPSSKSFGYPSSAASHPGTIGGSPAVGCYRPHPVSPLRVSERVFEGPRFSCQQRLFIGLGVAVAGNSSFMLRPPVRRRNSLMEEALSVETKSSMESDVETDMEEGPTTNLAPTVLASSERDQSTALAPVLKWSSAFYLREGLVLVWLPILVRERRLGVHSDVAWQRLPLLVRVEEEAPTIVLRVQSLAAPPSLVQLRQSNSIWQGLSVPPRPVSISLSGPIDVYALPLADSLPDRASERTPQPTSHSLMELSRQTREATQTDLILHIGHCSISLWDSEGLRVETQYNLTSPATPSTSAAAFTDLGHVHFTALKLNILQQHRWGYVYGHWNDQLLASDPAASADLRLPSVSFRMSSSNVTEGIFLDGTPTAAWRLTTIDFPPTTIASLLLQSLQVYVSTKSRALLDHGPPAIIHSPSEIAIPGLRGGYHRVFYLAAPPPTAASPASQDHLHVHAELLQHPSVHGPELYVKDLGVSRVFAEVNVHDQWLDQCIQEATKLIHRLSPPASATTAPTASSIATAKPPQVRLKRLSIAAVKAMITIVVSSARFPLDLSVREMPVSLSEVQLEDVHAEGPRLAHEFTANYIADTVLRTPSLLGSVELLGNPTGFIRGIAQGVESIVAHPVTGWAQAVRGFGKATASSISGFTGALSRIADRLALDPQFASIREEIHASSAASATHLAPKRLKGSGKSADLRAMNIASGVEQVIVNSDELLAPSLRFSSLEQLRQPGISRNPQASTVSHSMGMFRLVAVGLLSGMHSLSHGMISGATGVVSAPAQSFRAGDYSLRGLFTSVSRGLMGAVAKPVSGALGFLTAASETVMAVLEMEQSQPRQLLESPRLCIVSEQPLLRAQRFLLPRGFVPRSCYRIIAACLGPDVAASKSSFTLLEGLLFLDRDGVTVGICRENGFSLFPDQQSVAYSVAAEQVWKNGSHSWEESKSNGPEVHTPRRRALSAVSERICSLTGQSSARAVELLPCTRLLQSSENERVSGASEMWVIGSLDVPIPSLTLPSRV